MIREEFSTDKTFYMIQHVYNLYLKMEERYSNLGTEENYKFEFNNFRGTGQNITMRSGYFSVYDESNSESAVFEISTMDRDSAFWTEFILSNDSFSWYNGRYNDDLCLVVGDHQKDWNKRYIPVLHHSNAEETFDEYGEEYFFQQLTVQNIIEYELFQQEVNFYYKHLLPNLLREDIIINVEFELFNLKTLEGFRVI